MNPIRPGDAEKASAAMLAKKFDEQRKEAVAASFAAGAVPPPQPRPVPPLPTGLPTKPLVAFPPVVGTGSGGLPDPTEMIKQRLVEGADGRDGYRALRPSTRELVSKWLEETLATAPPPHQEHPARHLREGLEELLRRLEG